MAKDRFTGPGDSAQWLADCRERIRQWSKLHVDSFLDKGQQTLFEQAGHARHDNEQQRLFDAAQLLRDQRNSLQNSVINHIDQSFNRFLHNAATNHLHADDESNLALVDKITLEEQLAVESMSRRITTEASDVLYALNQRFAALRGTGPVSDQSNPVAPGVFAEALQQALQPHSIEIGTRLLIFKLFERHFMKKVPKLLALINYQFQAQGVLPHLRFHIKKHPAETVDETSDDNSADQEQSRLRQQQLSGLIQRLQAQRPANAPLGTLLPTVQVIAQLAPVQQKSAERLASAQTPQQILASQPEEFISEVLQHSHKVSRLDSELIEFVGLLFEYMLNNPHLGDAVKALLSYLHTPLMKLALQDRNFFQQAQHPARQLLNNLVAAGERWVEIDSRKTHSSSDLLVFQEMRRVVQRIVDEFHDDSRLFAELTFDFNRFIREHARRINLVEKRSQQAAAGEVRLRAVRQRVEKFLQQKTSALVLPAPMLTLLHEPWASFLTFNLLRFGRKSEQWQQAMLATGKLLRCLSGDPAMPASNLAITLQTAFTTVGYDSQRSKTVLDDLQRWHQQAKNLQPPPGSDAASKTPNDDNSIDTIALHSDINNQALLEQLLALESGNWFLFNADQPKAQQQLLKLSWQDRDSREFLFVNRRGQQSKLHNARDLISAIEQGRIRLLGPLDERPFFEQALENIADQLRNI